MYLSGFRMLVVGVGACSPGSFECFRPPWEVLGRKKDLQSCASLEELTVIVMGVDKQRCVQAVVLIIGVS